MSSEAVAESKAHTPSEKPEGEEGKGPDLGQYTSTKSLSKVGTKHGGPARVVRPDSFVMDDHFYPRVAGATIHPIVLSFFQMSTERIVKRYCHMNPRVDAAALTRLLAYKPKCFLWAGADLFHVTNINGNRQMVVVETNSCPSGQKSMPLLDEAQEMGGYKFLLENAFARLLRKEGPPECKEGALAVLYDKNYMEASGYAAAMAELTKEPVYLVEFYAGDTDASARWVDGVLQVRTEEGEWKPVRAAFRYVTQRPWTRIPLSSKTLVLNPTLACLAGGRNKLVASKAYDLFNAELLAKGTGVRIRTPETRQDVSKAEVPLYVNMFGGKAVVKVPTSNAGQGVYTICTKEELDHFMAQDFPYDKFIVQSLIGNRNWSSVTPTGQLYHVGTIPNKRNDSYVCDLRMMLSATDHGLRPVAVYARRARDPLADEITSGSDSWGMLGTNLSVKTGSMSWDTETGRLLIMSTKDFNRLGLGVDELIDGYVQTVLSVIAIDKMCTRLIRPDGSFNMELFRSLHEDDTLVREIMH